MQVLLNERAVRALVLVNSGRLKFDFIWKIGDLPQLAIKPQSGTVAQGQRAVCELAYTPHAHHSLNNHKITCQVVNGQTYTILLTGGHCLHQGRT